MGAGAAALAAAVAARAGPSRLARHLRPLSSYANATTDAVDPPSPAKKVRGIGFPVPPPPPLPGAATADVYVPNTLAAF